MKIYILTLLFLSLMLSCGKSSDELPECIQAKIDATLPLSSVQLIAVYKTNINDETHYWFNTGAVTYDGAEYIYDKDCNQVCSFCGFCVKSDCIDAYPDYSSDKWEVVWKP
jgi:hypothetical protein